MEPPRGRGKEVADEGIGGIIRITPAQAGKRKSATKETKGYEDHPRVGGEKCCSSLMRALWSGSPPRRRGKVHQHLCGLVGLGITPAWAGKRLTRPAMTGTPRDHPRVGEEKKALLTVRQALKGSPPRRRGKEVADEGIGGIIRITPAWAGKSLPQITSETIDVDHPSVGREKRTLHGKFED